MKIQFKTLVLIFMLLSACEYSVSGCDGPVCVNAASGSHEAGYCDETGRCASSCPSAQGVDTSMLSEITLARRVTNSCPAHSTVVFPNMTLDQTLDKAAREHAEDMARNSFVSDIGSNGLNIFDRVDVLASSDFALQQQLAQLVASGFSNAEEVVDFWLDNPAHCALLLSHRYSHLGASCARGVDNRTRWSVVLGGASILDE